LRGFVIFQFTPGVYSEILDFLRKGLFYYLESEESKPCRTQPFTDLQFGKDLKPV
jgi:hypothetical protein